MKTSVLKIISKSFIIVSVLGLLSVAAMAMVNPQDVMDLVHVKITNNDAFSSLRGIYGGVGLTICFFLIYLLITEYQKALLFLCFFWGAYAFSRILTILIEGPLGAFGTQWLIIETIFFIAALLILIISKRKSTVI